MQTILQGSIFAGRTDIGAGRDAMCPKGRMNTAWQVDNMRNETVNGKCIP